MKELLILLLVLGSIPAFAAHPPKQRITMEQAQKAALQVQPGATIESKELEHEGGRWVYSFDLRASDGKIHEILVDAKSGTIVSQKTETPAQEAAEAGGQAKEK